MSKSIESKYLGINYKKEVRDSKNVHTGMKADPSRGQYAVWKAKPVQESKCIFPMDTLEGLTHTGAGTMDISTAFPYEGRPVMHLAGTHVVNESDLGKRSATVSGGASIVRFDMHQEDVTAYTRISFWCYSDNPNRPNTWLYFVMVNGDGEAEGPAGLDSRTGVNIPCREWFQVIWEFAPHQRDSVKEFALFMDALGALPEDDAEYNLYFSNMCLEKVEPDYVDGWNLDSRIAYCHIGYLPDAPKRAVTQKADCTEFYILDAESGQKVYIGKVETVESDIGTYRVMDFSALQTTGEYVLEVDGRKTHSFPIAADVMASPIWKNINFFQRERCGCEVEGLHTPCCQNVSISHPDGRKLPGYGGWHDAGDLAQELCTTADAVTAMLEMAERLKGKDEALHDRLLEEAKWGLDWVVKTRFGDGYYAFHAGSFGWIGDVSIPQNTGSFRMMAINDSFGNFYRAGVQAGGYLSFREVNPRYAHLCLKNAEADFAFALQEDHKFQPKQLGNTAMFELQKNTRKGLAAVLLYRATGKQEYLAAASAVAEFVMACQQTELPDWDIPLRGFFWNEVSHEHITAYEHQSAESLPITFLVRLCEFAPEHPDASKWLNACDLYADYIKKTADMIQPYGLLPAAIYSIHTEPSSNTMRFEGEAFVRKLFHDEIANGIRLSDEYYLRRLPVSSALLRGFFGPLFAKACATAELSRFYRDKKLRDIALDQVAWMLGMNPFARSDMYAEGYGWHPMYTPYSEDMVGAIPVGIQANGDKDAPYLPSSNRPTFNEVWIHSSGRFLWTMASLADWF